VRGPSVGRCMIGLGLGSRRWSTPVHPHTERGTPSFPQRVQAALPGGFMREQPGQMISRHSAREVVTWKSLALSVAT
jgi:hypothetical protein